jgi:hypothetical protein
MKACPAPAAMKCASTVGNCVSGVGNACCLANGAGGAYLMNQNTFGLVLTMSDSMGRSFFAPPLGTGSAEGVLSGGSFFTIS